MNRVPSLSATGFLMAARRLNLTLQLICQMDVRDSQTVDTHPHDHINGIRALPKGAEGPASQQQLCPCRHPCCAINAKSRPSINQLAEAQQIFQQQRQVACLAWQHIRALWKSQSQDTFVTRTTRVQQPPQIPWGLGPLLLPVKKWQGAAPCIS